MKRILILGLLITLLIFAGSAVAGPPEKFSEETVSGHSNGNHTLDCTILRPWGSSSGPGQDSYPVIVWANGWGGNNIAGETTTDFYKENLIEWALDGPYIVVAANQWSAQESDVLACLQHIVDQNGEPGSEYQGVINTAKIGLAGHSQGGGAVVKAGDGEPNGFDITTVVAMNPYGPGWVNVASQDGPVMIVTGSEDDVTPESWTSPVFDGIQTNAHGGLYAVLQDAGHNDLGRYQKAVMLWWHFTLNDNDNAGKHLKWILDKDPWDTKYAFTEEFGF